MAPDTSIHYAETSNEQPRQSTPNIPNNTSQTSSTRTDTYFDEATISVTNITVQSGEDAFLVCSVMNLKGYVISWIRHTDINLLSVGKLRYTQDQRYQIFCDEFDSTWTLKVFQHNSKLLGKKHKFCKRKFTDKTSKKGGRGIF